MNVHTDVLDLLGAWALDACDGGETAAVEAHLEGCAACRVEAGRLRSAAAWLSVDRGRAAQTRMREATLARARRLRPPALLRTLSEAYAEQVALLDDVLAALAPADWRRPDPRHGTVRHVISHLARNDAMLAADLQFSVVSPDDDSDRAVRSGWREQADVLAHGLTSGVELDRPVRLAQSATVVRGPAAEPPQPRPLRDALVQRAFETWIHREDLAGVLGRPQPAPPPEQVRRIIDLAARLLPEALRANGVAQPGRAARLVLDGPGGGEWTVPLGHYAAGAPEPDIVIEAPAVEFARLVANRHTPATFPHTATGDGALAVRLLRVAATLGCD
jgi:uncharacterized protein (TIGR03083 family)